MSWCVYDIVFFIGGLLMAAIAYGKWKYLHFKGTGVKYIEPPFPFLGSNINIMMGREHMQEYISRVYNTFSDQKYIGLFEPQRPLILLRDLELIKQIGIKDFDNFHDHRMFVDEDLDPLFGRTLFSIRGNKWRDMRATLSPAFSGSKMKNMFIYIEECALEMVEFYKKQIQNEKSKDMIEIEVKEIFSRYTNDTIATSAFGLKTNSFEDPGNDFYTHGKISIDFTFYQMIKAIAFATMPKVTKLFRMTLIAPRVTSFFRNLVNDTIKNREKYNIVRHDMINILMEAKKGSLKHEGNSADLKDTGYSTVIESAIGRQQVKREWVDDDMAAQALIFFIGGFDTTSTLLTFLIYEMVRNPDIQKNLQEEIDNYRKEHGDRLTYQDIQHLKYLDNTVSETLRMWPPAAAIDRVCSKEHTLPPPSDSSEQTYKIYPNELVWIPIYGIHHDPEYYPDPYKFDPTRFSDENKHTINPTSYLPFGIGPRNCIGSRYALMVAKAIIFHMVANFEFVSTKKTEIPVTLKNTPFSLHSKNGIWVGLKPRSNKKTN